MSMKLSVLIVDDEPLGAARVERLLKGDPDLETVEIAEGAAPALERIQDMAPDIVFLDIEMPGMDGFQLLEKIQSGKVPYVIFVTAFEEHALRAFEVQAVDYLLKPITRQRLSGALQRAKNLLLNKNAAKRKEYAQRLAVRDENSVSLVKTSDIDWIEADGKHVLIHVKTKSFVLREGITAVAEKLDPARFVRIHRSHIVNIDRVARLQPLFHGEYRVLLNDGTALLLTRHYKKGMQDALGEKSL